MQSFPPPSVIKNILTHYLHRDVINIISDYLTVIIDTSMISHLPSFYQSTRTDGIKRNVINFLLQNNMAQSMIEKKQNIDSISIAPLKSLTHLHLRGFDFATIEDFQIFLQNHILAFGVNQLSIRRNTKIIFSNISAVTPREIFHALRHFHFSLGKAIQFFVGYDLYSDALVVEILETKE